LDGVVLMYVGGGYVRPMIRSLELYLDQFRFPVDNRHVYRSDGQDHFLTELSRRLIDWKIVCRELNLFRRAKVRL